MNERIKRHTGSPNVNTSFLSFLRKIVKNSTIKTKANAKATPPMIYRP